jgi:hypothetical protein
MIDELYRYKIKSQKLPKIFLEVDETILQATFVELLDYMTGKKVFFKASESESTDHFKNTQKHTQEIFSIYRV